MARQSQYSFAAALLVSLLLLPFLYSAFFTFPEGDDFSTAIRANFFLDIFSGIDSMFSAWWKWSGRYSYHFFSTFFGYACHSRILYSGCLFLVFGVAWISVFGIARELGRKDSRGQAVFMASFWLFVLLCTHGLPMQWYVHVEIFTIIGAYCTTMLYIWSLCRLWNLPIATRGAKTFCILSGVIATGFYEYSALMVLLVTLAAFFLARLYEHPHRAVYFMLVKVAVVSFLLMYLARGNFRRQTKRGATSDIMFSQLLNVWGDWWKYMMPAYLNKLYVGAVFVAAWFAPGWRTPLDKKLPAPLILGGTLLVFFGFSFSLTVVHAMSDVSLGGSAKLPVSIAQFSTIILFFGILSCRDWLRLNFLRLLGKPLSLALMLGILIAGNGNFFPILWDVVWGDTQRYAQAYEKRKRVMAGHKGETVNVMPLLHAPTTISPDSIQQGVKSWPNKYAALMYGLAGIDAQSPSAEEAYTEARKLDSGNWLEAGGGFRLAYVPSLALRSNDTYVFDWIFLEGAGQEAPQVRVLVLGEHSLVFRLPEFLGLPERLVNAQWPFRRTFQRPDPQAFFVDGRKLYAISLPQSDTMATGVGGATFISVNGSPLIKMLRGGANQKH